MQEIPSAAAQFQQAIPPPVNPLELAGQALGIQNTRQNLQLNQVKLQEAKQGQQDDQDIRAAAQQANGDPTKIHEILSTHNPRAADQFAKAFADRQKTEAETKKAQLENASKSVDLTGQIANSMNDEPSYQQGLAKLASTFGPQAVQALPPKYDAATVQNLKDSAMSVKDLTDAHLKKQDYDNKAKEIESQSAKNAAEADKNTEEANGLRRKGLAETLSLVKDQQGFDAAIADYKAHKPLKGEDLSAVYGTTYSPAVNAMAQQTLGKIKSPEQVAQEKDLKSAPGPEAQLLPPEVEAQKARLAQAGKTQPETPDLNSAVSTTRSGLKYVDRSQFTGKEQNALVDAANKAGIPAVSKETADLLSEIDNARSNLDYMNQAIGSKLAKDPTGRLFKGPANTIEKLAQSDPDLAAVGTYRSAAIQAMRAVAGAKGLRINRAEIEQAQENDIPKITDTLPVAQAKLKNMNAFLDNAEKAHLVRDRSAGAPSSPGGTLKNLSTDELLKRLK